MGFSLTLESPDLNYVAVLVAAAAYFLVGAVWYSPMLFGKAWMKALGRTGPVKMGHGAMPYVAAVLGSLAAAFTLAYLNQLVFTDGAMDAVMTALLVWFGLILWAQLSDVLFQGQAASLAAINAGFRLVGFVLMGVILGSWP